MLAVLPHQIPVTFRRLIHNPIGRLLFAALAAYIVWLKPVLGIAMFVLITGICLNDLDPAQEVERFTVLEKDKIKAGHRWFQEAVMKESPQVIQERKEDGGIIMDEVGDASPAWEDETTMHRQTVAIQDRPIDHEDSSELEYEQGVSSHMR